jgi:two-component system sensor histidine kinase YesM
MKWMKFNLKSKLIISYIILITLPISILGIKYYDTSKDVILELARQNALEIVKKNNQIIDEKLSKVQDISLTMIVDCGLFRMFNEVDSNDDYGLLLMDREVSKIINRYYSQSPDIYSAQLVTSYYTFGDRTKNIVPTENFYQSTLYSDAQAEAGRLVWIPTYNFAGMYHMNELKQAHLDYEYIFSMARIFNVSCVDNGKVINLDKNKERPVLTVNFKEDLYKRIYEDSNPMKETSFFVASNSRVIISHTDSTRLASIENSAWLHDIAQKNSGTGFVKIDGKEMIACYDVSKVTGWISVILIPPNALLRDILSTIRFYLVNLATILTCLSILFAYLISARITKPINKLLRAIKKMGTGNFNSKISDPGTDEFGLLITKFNHMNDKIKALIDENYVVKIREKETEIMVLNIQLNPHFLYNSLNIINWMAVKGEKEKTSKMLVSLSRMLQYTTYSNEETTVLSKDLEWLKEYVYIMENRFEGKFSVQYYINPLIMEFKVPKLFLQPFIENSLLHGFGNGVDEVTIAIYGWIQEDTVYFSIEDNGRGINTTRMQEILEGNASLVGINNVNKRLKLLYGVEFGVHIESEPGNGTRVLITIPIFSSGQQAPEGG